MISNNDPNVKDMYAYMIDNMHSQYNAYDYDGVNEIIYEISNTHYCAMTRCSTCIGINPNVVPTSNYKSKPYVVYNYLAIDVPITLVLTVSAINFVVSSLSIPYKTASYIITDLLGAGYAAGSKLYVNNTVYQYAHNICPSAVKEELVPFVASGNIIIKTYHNQKKTSYFYTRR